MNVTNATQSEPEKDLILIVEDDWEIANFIVLALSKTGFRAVHARNKTETMDQFEVEIPGLVVLDVMLPGEDGFRILGTIRQRFDTPVIMLTALTELNNRVKGLVSGADDYMAKPFHTSELLARISAVLRRKQRPATPHQDMKTLSFDGWRVDGHSRTVHDPEGTAILLTSGEFDILWTLCTHAGEVLGRDKLVQISQNRMIEPYDRSVDTLVSRLRRKLKDPGIIKTVRNGGYVFAPNVTELDT